MIRPGQLGQLVVAHDQVNPVGILAFESRDKIDQPMRAVGPVFVVLVDLVDQLLEHQMAIGMLVEGRHSQGLAKRWQVSVQVADDHDVKGGIERDDRPGPARSRAEELGGLADGGQDFLRVGHGRDLECAFLN